MATIAELERALIAADAAGNTEDARALAAALVQARGSAQPERISIGQSGPSTLESIGMGAADPIHGGAQMLTKMLPQGVVRAGNEFNNWLADKTGLVARLPEGGVDQQVREREAAYQAQRQAAGDSGIDWPRMAGNVLSPANVALGARLPAAAGLGGRMLTGAAGGAAGSALTPVTEGDFYEEKAKQAGIGAVFGAAVPLATGVAARLVSPRASTDPALALLKREGVKPTLGQTLGGAWNAAEEKMTVLPFTGDAIAHARRTARDQFNQAAINRVGAPIGAKVRGVGQEAVAQISDKVDDAYDAARNALGAFKIDRQGVGDITKIYTMAAQLPPKERKAFQNVWESISSDISPRNVIDSSVFKKIDSKLGLEAAKYSGAQDAYQRNLGAAFTELKKALQEAAKRANPDAAAKFSAADEAFANLVRVQRAANAASRNEGVFTPGQLISGIRQSDRSVRDNMTAKGRSLMQDLGNAGQKVIGNKVPDSGTTGRLLMGGGALASAMVNPAIPAGLLGGAVMYTPQMQSVLRALASSRPESAQTIAEAIRKASPALIPGAGQMGAGLLDY